MLPSPSPQSPRESVTTARYRAPLSRRSIYLSDLLSKIGRTPLTAQGNLFRGQPDVETEIYYAGDLSLLSRACVSVIGARNVSAEGAARARRISKELAYAGVVVTSGLAKGVDVEAHSATLEAGGHTVAVIGTPLDKCYPIENARIQEEIWLNHLLISQFRTGQRTFPSDFPKRNRLMAAITDASVIIEASDTSGTLHQAVECVNLGRWLFIANSLFEDSLLEWPRKFLKYEKCVPLRSVIDITDRVLHRPRT
ncbi:MAG: DNA-processing protein DprA [Mesorhizobium sp.]|nr:DNA-processing protein DprA [Mesorhizobium sp.]